MRPTLSLPFCLIACLLCAAVRAASPTPDAPRAAAYTAWSSSTLFLGVKVPDPMVVGNQTAPLSQPWLDDAAAFYLDLDPTDGDALNERCLRVIISAAGGATVQRAVDGAWQDDPTWFQLSRQGIIRYGVAVDGAINDSAERDHGYTIEVGLAWSLLRVQPPLRQRPTDPLPAIGLAVAVHAQGDTQAVSCWPPAVREDDLPHPSRWGRLQFGQTGQPLVTADPVTSATLTHTGPVVDGKLDGMEWLTAGVCAFPLRQGLAVVPVEPGRQAVSLIGAWYVLDPPAGGAHQPLEPPAPGAGADAPLYHLQQIYDARRAGIDALAIYLPTGVPRDRLRTHLAALLEAVSAYDRANSATFFTDTPLLLPIVDLQRGSEAAAAGLLDDFYRLTPPQFRLMTSDAAGQWRYPVICVATSGQAGTYPDLDDLGATLRTKLGRPVGWLLDSAWPDTTIQDGVLARCAWDAAPGLQLGQGSLRTALIAPGVDAGRDRYVARRGGATYDNGWLKIANARPDFVLIRSWNDLADGTEIAPTRQSGTDYRDRTRLATAGLLEGRKFGLTLLQHTLPAVIPAGAPRTIELLLKNAGGEKMLSREGFRVDYRLLRDGRQVLHGPAVDRLALMELSAARLHFDLPTSKDKRPLPSGTYQLQLDFRRNKIPQLEIPGLTETLWTLSLPLTLGPGSSDARLSACELPLTALPGMPLPVTVRLRLPDRLDRKTPLALRLRWATDKGTILAAASQVRLPGDAEPGAPVQLSGLTPPAPGNPGWYLALLDTVRGTEPPVRLHAALVHVVETDLRAQFLEIGLPGQIADAKTVEVPVALRNPGATAWPATGTTITYQWQRWDGRPLPGGSGAVPLTAGVPPGKAISQRLSIPLPPGSGAYRCAFGLSSHGQTARLEMSPLQRVSPVRGTVLRPERAVQVDLSDAAGPTQRDCAAQTELPAPRGGLDGAGTLFPLEEFLPDGTHAPAGYPAGYGLDSDAAPARAMPFLFLPLRNGRAPVIRAQGQTLALPDRRASALYLAALSTGTPAPTTLTVRYADEQTQTLPLQVSSWLGAPAFNEPVLLRTRFLRTAHGDDWTRQGSVFVYRLPLDPARSLRALVLPTQPELCLFAVTLEPVE